MVRALTSSIETFPAGDTLNMLTCNYGSTCNSFSTKFPLGNIAWTMYYQHLTFCMTKMNPILVKTFGGLSKQYYIRQFFFAALMTGLLFWVLSTANETHPDRAMPWWMLVCVPLYPYSRFVYESIVEFIVGDNVFFVNAIMMMFVKIFTMLTCLMFAPIIAPIGLIYLYFYHSRKSA